MPRLALVASAALALVAAGCTTTSASARAATGALTRYASDVRVAFPPDEFVTGVGQSAASLDAAESKAKLQAASTLRESLRGEFTSEEGEETGPEGTTATHSARMKLSTMTETNLAPYFRAIPELARHSDGGFLAVAVARRDALAERLVQEADQFRHQALDMFARVVAARDLVGQALAWCEARKTYEEVSWRAMAFHVVSGQPLRHVDLDASARLAARAVADTRAALPVRVAYRGPDSLLGAVAGLVADRIRAAGFATEIRSAPEPKRPLRQGQVALTLARSTSCSQPATAIFECRLNVKAEFRSGGDGGATLVSLQGDPSAGRVMGSGPAGAEALAACQFGTSAFVDRAASQFLCLLSANGCTP